MNFRRVDEVLINLDNVAYVEKTHTMLKVFFCAAAGDKPLYKHVGGAAAMAIWKELTGETYSPPPPEADPRVA